MLTNLNFECWRMKFEGECVTKCEKTEIKVKCQKAIKSEKNIGVARNHTN